MSSIVRFFRRLFGLEEDEVKTTYPSIYEGRLLLGLKSFSVSPTRYEYSHPTTSRTSYPSHNLGSRSNRQTTTIVLKSFSVSHTRYEYSHPTTPRTNYPSHNLGSQSNRQTTSTKPNMSSETIQKGTTTTTSCTTPPTTSSSKPNKSSETVQKPKVLSPSTLQPDSSSSTPKPRYSSKPTLSQAPFNPTMDQKKTSYIWVEEGTTSLTYKVPEDVEALIKKEILPRALKKPLSPSTYKDFIQEGTTTTTSCTTPPTTSSSKPNKSSETVQKPKVLSPSTLQPDSSSSTPKPRYSSKPTLSQAPFNPTMDQKKTSYIWVEEGTTSLTYKVPEDVEALIKKEILPRALKKSLSPSTYKDFIQEGATTTTSCTTPPTTSSSKPNKSSETVQKPKVLSPSTLQPDSSSSTPKPRYSSKPTLSQAPFNPTMDQKKTSYIWVEKGTTSLTYKVPEDVEALIKKEILPRALKKPLSPSTYKDFIQEGTTTTTSCTTPPTTSSSKPNKSSETVQKPNVLSPSTLQPDSSSSTPKPRYSSKPTLSQAPFNPTMDQKKTSYIWVEEGTTSLTYKVPEDVEALIKKEILPRALKKSLSPSTYKDFIQEGATTTTSCTTPPTTSSSKPNKSSETVQKPKVLSPSTLQPDSSSSTPKPRYSSKPTLSQAPFNPTMDQKKTSYIWVEKGTTSLTYKVPEDVEALIKKEILPRALKKPLSPSTYKDFIQEGTTTTTSCTTPPTTSSSKPNKSSETVQKPNVLSPSTLQPDSSSSTPKPRYSSKPTLSQAPFNPTMDQKKTSYIWVEEGTTSLTYKVPEDVEALIKKEILPRALKKPLSPSTYKDFFHTMLYAEDWYIEKWNGFEMENVILEVVDAAIYRKKDKDKNLNKTNLEEEDDKVFVAFEMDSLPQNRPFLLSRDFASVRPSDSTGEPFQGIIYRVVKSNQVLVEFGEDFHSQHYHGCKYDVKFSFNRVCLKRAHEAVDRVSDILFKNFLFPTGGSTSKVNMLTSQSSYMNEKLDMKQIVALDQICKHHGPPPLLVEGPLCITGNKHRSKRTGLFETKELSRTGILIRETVLRINRTKPNARILICAPTNVTCDELVKSLGKEIPESDMFRGNAAFREKDEVLLDILPSCRISGECFSCPPLEELAKFKVVSSTYMSCFRLHNEGLVGGHFSHVFMLDASATTEPEALVALAYFAHESTNVVVTGERGNSYRWVRSTVARMNGLMKSYFERLCESKLYEDICQL